MKTSNSRITIKKSLLLLDTSIYSTKLCLGSVIAPVFFEKGKRALLIDKEKQSALVFALDQEEADFSVLLLTELISIVREMKSQGLIMDVDCKKTDLEFFYSNSNNELTEDSIPERYYAANDTVLELLSIPVLKDGTTTLVGFSLPSQLFTPLNDILLTVYFPTPDYKDYISRGFYTIESYHTQKALLVSWIAVIVAILIGILSPLGAVIIGNRYGHTSLDPTQYQEIIQTLRGND